MLLGASLCKDILVILTMISHTFIYLFVYLFITTLFVLSLEIGLTKKLSEATSLFLVAVKTRIPSQAQLDGQKTILTTVCLLPARKVGSPGSSLTFIGTFLPRMVRSTLLLSDLH